MTPQESGKVTYAQNVTEKANSLFKWFDEIGNNLSEREKGMIYFFMNQIHQSAFNEGFLLGSQAEGDD